MDDKDRKAVKLNDFVSRLRGYLDVLGINEKNNVTPSPTIKLRRAIVLRGLLEKWMDSIFITNKMGKFSYIDPKLIDALLGTKEYIYGIRSMEAIVQMSRLINGKFVAASLPAPDQMKMHVDIRFFNDILNASCPSVHPNRFC